MKPKKLECHMCKKQMDIEEVKYHTREDRYPIHVFCGPECSLIYYSGYKRNAN